MVNVIIEEPAFTIRITGGIGAQGSKGDPGNGIASAVLNDDYTLTLNFTDGTSYTTEPIRGAQGETGATGNGISSAVLNPDYTLTLYFTDGTHYTTTSIRGEQGERGEQGAKGDPGFSPIATVSKSGTVTTLTVTDEDGTTTAEILDGAPGAKGDTGASGVYIGESTPTDPTVNVWVDTDGDPDAVVKDVQLPGGTSIVDSQGVAVMPKASTSQLGIAGINTTFGIGINDSGKLHISPAGASGTKSGASSYKPITPDCQHQSVFYGLAKAAGSDEKNSTLPVGQYTDAAKKAIREMLGIPNMDSEVIADITTTEDSSAVTVTTDLNGQPFSLRIAKVMVTVPPSTTGTADHIYGEYYRRNMNDSNTWSLFPTLRMFSKDRSLNTYEFESYNGLSFNRAYTASTFISTSQPGSTLTYEVLIKSMDGFRFRQYTAETTLIPAGTRILIWGVRV